jgi:hypothetical protein
LQIVKLRWPGRGEEVAALTDQGRSTSDILEAGVRDEEPSDHVRSCVKAASIISIRRSHLMNILRACQESHPVSS